MLNPTLFDDLETLKKRLKGRNYDANVLVTIAQLSKKRKTAISQMEDLKAARNTSSKEIGALMGKAKSDPACAKEADEKKSSCPQAW